MWIIIGIILFIWFLIGMKVALDNDWEILGLPRIWSKKQKLFAHFLIGPFWWFGLLKDSILFILTLIFMPIFLKLWNYLGKNSNTNKDY